MQVLLSQRWPGEQSLGSLHVMVAALNPMRCTATLPNTS
jgi:hypothetical protein